MVDDRLLFQVYRNEPTVKEVDLCDGRISATLFTNWWR